ncbi:MAG TPA: FAD-dependent oxidoreductase [Acidimicrobiales bacterium]|nr:FAD-dependent oxidoreductase [Acidimicrobiales bacterium]
MGGGDCEFVVVGAGALGLSAARALARRGREVVVCEQAAVGHGGSGSKGSARIFRLGYDDPAYVRLAVTAQRLWGELEDESQTTLLTTTGQVTVGDDLDVLAAAMAAGGAPFQRLAPDEVTARFPALSVATAAVYEPASGVIAADRALAALGQAGGVEIREQTRVTRLDDTGSAVHVVTRTPEKEVVLRASAVVVCAGPWTGPLVSAAGVDLPSWPTLEQVAYLAPRVGSVDDVPVFVERRRPWFYGLPVRAGGLVKVSFHGAGPVVVPDRPDGDGDPEDPDPALVAALTASAHRLLPGLAPEAVATERCVYDSSPDGDFVLDRVGSIVVGSGTSGHGFKFAPLIGEVLADLATGADVGRELGAAGEMGRFALGRLRSAGGGRGPTVHP